MDIKASDTKDDAPSDLSLSPDFPNGGARVIRQALEEEGVETASDAKPSDPPKQSHDALMTGVDDQHQPPSGRDSMPPRTDDLFETNDAPLVSENRAAEHRRSEKTPPKSRVSHLVSPLPLHKIRLSEKKQHRMMRDVRIHSWKSC